MGEYAVGPVEEFPEGRGVGVRIGGLRLAVFNVAGELYAIHDSCPHKHAPLHEAGAQRFNGDRCGSPYLGEVDADRRQIKCPWHGLRFDLETGESGVLGRRIPTYDVEVRNGEVVVST